MQVLRFRKPETEIGKSQGLYLSPLRGFDHQVGEMGTRSSMPLPRSCLNRGDHDVVPAERPPAFDGAPAFRSGRVSHPESGERDVIKRGGDGADRDGVGGRLWWGGWLEAQPFSCRGAGRRLSWARWALLLCIVGLVEGGRWSSDGRWLPGNEPER